ncbi:MAG: 2-oxoacid:ferredoxin oxidoreductase subunit gamma [Candidatus Omnitrophica bacterium]|nr:2-oxoacid:ferredoxin oxidoreductase subunit gamma [Candidatus Omnitrophota bacterium]
MKSKILISGFGGQGIMSLGKIIALTALKKNYAVTWFPSYGAEVRGGTAHCFVIIASSQIASPLIDIPDVGILFNHPSVEKFAKTFGPSSLVILNKDMCVRPSSAFAVSPVLSPLNSIALEQGSIKTANIVALGILCARLPRLLDAACAETVLRAYFPPEKHETNLRSFRRGMEEAHTDARR